MVNESCLRRCKRREEHYGTIGNGQGDLKFHLWCNTIKMRHPYELLMSNFIRPEDMVRYEKMGLRYFKVTGRSKPFGWLEEVIQAYLQRRYNGNLMRLLGIDPNLNAELFIYLSNDALGDFLSDYPFNSSVEEEIVYCEDCILKLFQSGDFQIRKKGIEPEIQNARLRYTIQNHIYSKT